MKRPVTLRPLSQRMRFAVAAWAGAAIPTNVMVATKVERKSFMLLLGFRARAYVQGRSQSVGSRHVLPPPAEGYDVYATSQGAFLHGTTSTDFGVDQDCRNENRLDRPPRSPHAVVT